MTDTQKYFAAITLVSLLICAAPKQQHWWEDGQAVHKGTAAWHPYRQYSPDVEQGLGILASTDPTGVSYFRSRGYPIIFVPGVQDRMADTTADGVIEIPYRFQNQPAQLAVVLSHEIVHEQRHDPFTRAREYPLWRRLLWHQEEEVAHNKDFWVALNLWPTYPSVWNVMGREWIWEPFLYWLIGPLCLLDVACLLLLAYSVRRGVLKLFTPRLSQRQTA